MAAQDNLLVSASRDKTVRLWKQGQPSSVALLEGHAMAVTGVALAQRSNRLLSGARDGVLKLWDISNSACVGEAVTSRNVVGRESRRTSNTIAVLKSRSKRVGDRYAMGTRFGVAVFTIQRGSTTPFMGHTATEGCHDFPRARQHSCQCPLHAPERVQMLSLSISHLVMYLLMVIIF